MAPPLLLKCSVGSDYLTYNFPEGYDRTKPEDVASYAQAVLDQATQDISDHPEVSTEDYLELEFLGLCQNNEGKVVGQVHNNAPKQISAVPAIAAGTTESNTDEDIQTILKYDPKWPKEEKIKFIIGLMREFYADLAASNGILEHIQEIDHKIEAIDRYGSPAKDAAISFASAVLLFGVGVPMKNLLDTAGATRKGWNVARDYRGDVQEEMVALARQNYCEVTGNIKPNAVGGGWPLLSQRLLLGGGVVGSYLLVRWFTERNKKSPDEIVQELIDKGAASHFLGNEFDDVENKTDQELDKLHSLLKNKLEGLNTEYVDLHNKLENVRIDYAAKIVGKTDAEMEAERTNRGEEGFLAYVQGIINNTISEDPQWQEFKWHATQLIGPAAIGTIYGFSEKVQSSMRRTLNRIPWAARQSLKRDLMHRIIRNRAARELMDLVSKDIVQCPNKESTLAHLGDVISETKSAETQWEHYVEGKKSPAERSTIAPLPSPKAPNNDASRSRATVGEVALPQALGTLWGSLMGELMAKHPTQMMTVAEDFQTFRVLFLKERNYQLKFETSLYAYAFALNLGKRLAPEQIWRTAAFAGSSVAIVEKILGQDQYAELTQPQTQIQVGQKLEQVFAHAEQSLVKAQPSRAELFRQDIVLLRTLVRDGKIVAGKTAGQRLVSALVAMEKVATSGLRLAPSAAWAMAANPAQLNVLVDQTIARVATTGIPELVPQRPVSLPPKPGVKPAPNLGAGGKTVTGRFLGSLGQFIQGVPTGAVNVLLLGPDIVLHIQERVLYDPPAFYDSMTMPERFAWAAKESGIFVAEGLSSTICSIVPGLRYLEHFQCGQYVKMNHGTGLNGLRGDATDAAIKTVRSILFSPTLPRF